MNKIFKYKYFIYQLTRVSVLSRYKKTRLGLFWMLLSPILTVITWVILHKAGIFNPGDTGIAYPAYVFFSSTLWTFFFEAYRSVSESVTFHSKMLLNHKLPYGTVVIERTGFHLANFIIPLLINIPVILIFGGSIGFSALFFPLAIIPLLFMGIALGMFVAVLKVVAVDFSNVIDEVIKVVKYLTPVVYAANADLGFLSHIVKWNPLTYLIGFPRDIMLGLGTQYISGFGITLLAVVIFFLLAWRFYTISTPLLVERLFGN